MRAHVSLPGARDARPAIADRIAVTLEEPVRLVPAAAIAGGLGALVLYRLTLLPGLSFGDWAEMQTAPALLEVPHPTGFPLMILLGRLWLLVEPLGSVAFRMNLFSAVAVSLAVLLTVLVSARLGARPLPALAGGLVLTTAGTVWSEATVAEVNGLHLLMVTLLLWLALRWRDEQRDRWLLLGALCGGLAVSNHLLALGALAVLVPLVLWAGRRRLLRAPSLLPAAAALGLLGLAPYLFIPIRVALSGPAEYPALRTWSGIWYHVTGQAYRSDMHFLSLDVVGLVLRDLPGLLAYAAGQSNVPALVVAGIGGLVLLRRDPWAALATAGLAGVTVELFAGYRGDLPHYLLVAWMVVGVWFALGADRLLEAARDGLAWLARAGQPPSPPSPETVALSPVPPSPGGATAGVAARLVLAAAALAVPVSAGAANYAGHDLAGDRSGDTFVDEVFSLLPEDAVLYTYWDAGEPLHHARCVDGRRPDLVILAPDDWVSFRPCEGLGAIAALSSGRPLFALAYAGRGLETIAGRTTSIPVATLAVPYGGRVADHTAELVELVPLPAGAALSPGAAAGSARRRSS